MKAFRFFGTSLTLTAALAMSVLLAGCGESENGIEDAAEETGQAVEQAGEDAANAAEDAAQGAENAAEDATN